MRQSKAVAADLMRVVTGEKGALLLALIVCLAALTTVNAAIFTGARTNYALGRDFALFARLGSWREAEARPETRCFSRAPSRSRWSWLHHSRPTGSAPWWPTPRRCSGRFFCLPA